MSFTFKINDKSVRNLEKNVRDAFNKAIRSERMMNEIGELVVTDVVNKTREGRSIPNGSRLKPLSAAWIKRRKKLAEYNQTHDDYDPEDSNLTFTGQLLNSLTWVVEGAGKIKIFFEGMHDPYKNKDGENIGGRVPNETIAEGQSLQGRPIVGVRPVIERRIGRVIRGYIKRALLVARLTSRDD